MFLSKLNNFNNNNIKVRNFNIPFRAIPKGVNSALSEDKFESVSLNFSEKLTDNVSVADYQIFRDYIKTVDDSGYFYVYEIFHENGTKLLDLSRGFQKLTDNKTQTIINGNKYTTLFNDDRKMILVIHPDDKKQFININQKINNPNLKNFKKFLNFVGYSDEADNSNKLWNACKNLPADLLCDIDKYVDYWIYSDDIKSFTFPSKKFLSSGIDISFIAHEIGHNKSYESGLSNDENLISVFNKEKEQFCDKFSKSYFDKYLEYYSKTDGLDELISDVNLLMTTYGYNDEKVIKRAELLAQYFPKTVCYISHKLNFS